MFNIDWKKVASQIHDMSELVDEEYDVDVCEGTAFRYYTKKYSFSGYIEVAGKPVYTSGSFINELDNFELSEFASENEDLELYLEDYNLEEIAELIA